ncbi:MAG: DUF362 domain-containing protein [Eggerthellaceae bacterium]|nr:DUF362 domain-containing protein [Eggerthellaceae bacterium]
MVDIDRRDFVKGATVFGASIAIAGITGCANSGEILPPQSPMDAYYDAHPELDRYAQPDSAEYYSFAASSGHVNTDNSTLGGSPVYYTEDISPEGLLSVFQALGWQPEGNVGVRIDMGEKGNSNYLHPKLVHPIVEEVEGTFIDTTTISYTRSSVQGYLDVANDHGFTYAPVDILDEEGGVYLPIEGGTQQTKVEVGSHYSSYDSIVTVSHFEGHRLAGFCGTFLGLATGLTTYSAKLVLIGAKFEPGEPYLGRVAEYSKGILDDLGPNVAFVNVLCNISVDCDGEPTASEPIMADIGIMASLDPLALERASLDQIYLSEDPGAINLIRRIEGLGGPMLLDLAEEMGLGNQVYELIPV